MERRRKGILVLVLTGWLALSGCMMFCPEPSPHRRTAFGEVKVLDFPTCRRLRILGQEVNRTRQGRLWVTVHWLNSSRKTYKAELKVSFFDAEGLAEKGSYRWDLERFPPGEATDEWESSTAEAVHAI